MSIESFEPTVEYLAINEQLAQMVAIDQTMCEQAETDDLKMKNRLMLIERR